MTSQISVVNRNEALSNHRKCERDTLKKKKNLHKNYVIKNLSPEDVYSR